MATFMRKHLGHAADQRVPTPVARGPRIGVERAGADGPGADPVRELRHE